MKCLCLIVRYMYLALADWHCQYGLHLFTSYSVERHLQRCVRACVCVKF